MQGRVYYFNKDLRKTSWEKPACLEEQPVAPPPPPTPSAPQTNWEVLLEQERSKRQLAELTAGHLREVCHARVRFLCLPFLWRGQELEEVKLANAVSFGRVARWVRVLMIVWQETEEIKEQLRVVCWFTLLTLH